MAEISQITLPSGTTYDIRDDTARELIQALTEYTDYLGVTTSVLTDGEDTNPITINGESVIPVVGNIATYGSAEFIYNGSAWQEFGDLSMLGALAYKDTASGSITPSGTISTPTFTGAEVSYTPEGSITVADYTPEGTISTPTVTVTPTTTPIANVVDAGSLSSCTLPNFTATVSGTNLTLGWSSGSFDAGRLPTLADEINVLTDVSAASSQPSFTGTAKAPIATFNGATSTITATGTISTPTFTGNSTTITVS